jgi:uncharacterized protein YndB with AHSA1/START domain
MSEQTPQNAPKEDIVVKRIIDAPVDMVWKAWTEPEYVMRWWGPKAFTSPSAKVDLREGGKYIFCMEAPPEQGGARHYSAGVYTKIVPMKLLEFTQGLSDAEGNPIDPASVGMPPDFPGEMRMTVKFHAIRPDMTELTITEYEWTMGQMAVYSFAGMHQSIDKLAEAMNSERGRG